MRIRFCYTAYVAYWPDSEVAESPDDFRYQAYSGLVALTASLSESDPKPTFEQPDFRDHDVRTDWLGTEIGDRTRQRGAAHISKSPPLLRLGRSSSPSLPRSPGYR